ncbi:MAG: DUF2283 domain-containing protein [Candidatus Omnitrophota bacterium]|jgi:uncharacterized protein YuzE
MHIICPIHAKERMEQRSISIKQIEEALRNPDKALSTHGVYIDIEKRKVIKTREFAPEVFLDFDYKGEFIGVELLNPCTLYLKKVAKRFHRPELAKVHPRIMAERVFV